MKAAFQSRTQPQFRVLLVGFIVVLGICLIERPVALAAVEASPEAAKKESDKKDKDAKADSKKDKSESPDSKAADGKADHKDGAKSSTATTDSKSKTTATKKEPEKSKAEKVRLAMLTLKDSLPESAEQAGPFGENKL